MMANWISAPTRYLNQAERVHNAKLFWDFFVNVQGWTAQSVAAMLGNIEVESSINPGLWQGREIPSDPYTATRGFGLTQWTPATKVTVWARDNNLDYRLGDVQLQRILYEQQNNLQWSTDNILSMTWDQFITSTESPEILARVFVWAYEIPAAPDIPQRQSLARKWYNSLRYPIPIWMMAKAANSWRKGGL